MPLKAGDEVTILPGAGAQPSEVLEIGRLHHAGPVFLQLADGRMFATIDGAGLNCGGCAAPATDEHRAALKAKG